MKPITLTILLSVLAIVANSENPKFLSETRQDSVQNFQRSTDEIEDSTGSRSDEETLDEDSVMKVRYPILERK